MRLTAFTDFALRALMRLAGEPDRSFATNEIAAEFGISRNHLAKVVRDLADSGFISTQRGVGGGFMLARSARSITIGEVLRYIEGSKSPRHSTGPGQPLNALWNRIDIAVSEVIDRTTFAELVRNWRESQARYVPNWEI